MDPFRHKQRDVPSIFWTFGCRDGRKEVASMGEWWTVGLVSIFLVAEELSSENNPEKEKRMELWNVLLFSKSRTAFPLVLPLGTRPLSCLAQWGINLPSGNLAILSLWRECWVQGRECFLLWAGNGQALLRVTQLLYVSLPILLKATSTFLFMPLGISIYSKCRGGANPEVYYQPMESSERYHRSAKAFLM